MKFKRSSHLTEMKNTTTRPLMSNKISSTKNGLYLFELLSKGSIDVIHTPKIIASTISYQKQLDSNYSLRKY